MSSAKFKLMVKIKPPDSLQAIGAERVVEIIQPDRVRDHLIPEVFRDLKHEDEARAFKLIDDINWDIATSEPTSESSFFENGHSAMSIISVIGPQAVGKSDLLNKIVKKKVFKTRDKTTVSAKHLTRGVDVYSNHHRIILDCQPLLSSSILDDFLSGASLSQFPKDSQISEALTSTYMISLQLVTFLMATSDYVILMSNWMVDLNLLKLLNTAIMLIGEGNLRAKLIFYSRNDKIHDERFKQIVESMLGRDKVDRFFLHVDELIEYINPYSSHKCDLYQKDPATFSGRNWLSSCQRLWNNTIRNSSMFSDYAFQLCTDSD